MNLDELATALQVVSSDEPSVAPIPKKTRLPGEKIPVGERDTTLFKAASSLARLGASEENIRDTLWNLYANDMEHKPTDRESEVKARIAQKTKRVLSGAAYDVPVVVTPTGEAKPPDPRVVILENMKTRSVRELLADDTLTEPEAALDGIFGMGEVLVLGGPPKAMKSWTVKAIGLSLASGTPWLGFKVPSPHRVIYLSAEGLEARLRARFQTLIGYTEVEAEALERFHSISTLGRIKLDTDAGEATFLRLIEPFEVVIIDPYYRFQEKGVENSHDDQRKMQDLMDRVKGMGKAIIIVHHLRKPGQTNAGIEELRGAGLSGFTDSAIILNRVKGKSDDRFVATFDIRNYEPIADMDLIRDGVVLSQTERERKAPGGVTPENVAEILSRLGPLSATDLYGQIQELNKVGYATAQRAALEALSLRIVLKGEKTRDKYYVATVKDTHHDERIRTHQEAFYAFKDE